MSQANINLPNSAGNLFRANNNAALAAIMSNNAGPSPPGSPDVGWFWLDTNTPTATIWSLNIYTGAAWLPILQVDAANGLVYPVQGIPVGASLEWNSDTLPPGFLFENGAAVSRATYSLLFARLGTSFGAGDGSSTFNLPDKRNVTAIGKGNMGGAADRGLLAASIVGFNPLTLGAAGGSQVVILPFHGHPLFDPGHTHGVTGVGLVGNNLVNGTTRAVGTGDGVNSGYFQDLLITLFANTTGASVVAQGTTNASGMQPSIVVNKIIFTGIFV